jgi:molybdopterin-binding protein
MNTFAADLPDEQAAFLERFASLYYRNRFPGAVEEIVCDKVVSELVIRTAPRTVTSITPGSVQRMNLTEGDAVFAIIKATKVSVEKEKPVTSPCSDVGGETSWMDEP